jgi:radical SAM enzyme (TIGR01210 family)
MSEEHVNFRQIMHQIDYIFDNPQVLDNRDDIKKVIVSNNGSVLDEDTFSSTALMYLVAQVNTHFPNLEVLSLESRAEHVDVCELEFLRRALHEGSMSHVEIAIGFEVFDDKLRNKVFQKGLSKKQFEKFVNLMADHSFWVKCYFMLKPCAGMSTQEAIDDIHAAIDYLAELAEEKDMHINMHLNPTFVGEGTKLHEDFKAGKFEPPTLVDTARAAMHARGKPITVYLGISDEGLAVPGGSFIREGDEGNLTLCRKFNETQNYGFLEEVVF